jgi:hypothetical protein
MEEDEISRAFTMHETEIAIQSFGGSTLRKEINMKTCT